MPTSLTTRLLDVRCPDYPPAVLELPTRSFPGALRWCSPPTLYLRGTLPGAPLLAVIGTRTPGPASVHWTERTIGELSHSGWAIGSGGAEGIDTTAHRAAIAHGLQTVVVTVGGLDTLAKRPGGDLFQAILEAGGAILSLDPDGTKSERSEYFRRNHVLAALSSGVLAVELRPKAGHGGTGHTVRAAMALNRHVMTVAHPPWSQGGAGAVALTRLGVPLVATAVDVRRLLGLRPPTGGPDHRASAETTVRAGAQATSQGSLFSVSAAPTTAEPAVELSPDATAILHVLGERPTHLDALVLVTGRDAPRVARALLECSLEGLVREGPPGSYRRVAL